LLKPNDAQRRRVAVPQAQEGESTMTVPSEDDDSARVRFVHHRGKIILIQDYSNLQPGQEFLDLIQKARKMIDSQPFYSVLTLVDVTNSVFDTEVLVILKDFVKANTPYIKSTAVVGITGLKEVGLMAVTKAAGRPLKTFSTREEAMDFLTGQE
jgi:hypothetical protein